MPHKLPRFTPHLLILLLIFAVGVASADHTPDPTSVTIVGDLQSELGCPGDWDPACAATHLGFDANDDVWQGVFNVPAGDWDYKAALNDSWDENYGQNATPGGANIDLVLGAATDVKFYYSHETHWITDNQNSRIAVAPGSYQDEIGCPGDWLPDCLRSWLQDPDGDGTYTFSTDAIPAGNYEFKVAINEDWAENYGAGGVPGGANIAFTVPDGATVTFFFESATNTPTVVVTGSGHDHDNNIEYFGLGHNSQEDLYRVPFGAVVPGTEVTLRFRTYHYDVTGVTARFYSTASTSESFHNMTLAAEDVSCYDPDQPDESCDYWQTTITPSETGLLYYRFIIKDGSATAYYDDDVFIDGGWGEATPALQDDSYVITVYDPDFEPIGWMQDAVVYQIFPDRFRNGVAANDPDPSEPRYGYPDNPLDQIITKDWEDLPEGYCRNYVNPAVPCAEQPRGRDYFGGDLQGVQSRLNYLKSIGVTVIYFNPIFEAASNHLYDTQDYYSIDHFFGDNAVFENFVQKANERGIRIILDGVFNHVSSDSAYFDRYSHFAEVGACESLASPYRDWFYFTDVAPGTGVCVGSDGSPNSANYNSWFGFDSLPVLNKDNPGVRELVYADENAVARYWLDLGASGWRLDVMGDPSFPADFWPEFRDAVKEEKGDAVIVGELWKKHETLDKVQGDMADTSMNYRFRNAILGFFGTVDNKGFPDDGQSNQPPTLFARKLMSIREDYPDAAYYTMMNLLGSHDTMRILWALTPGENNREDREFDAANLAHGKAMLELATVVQYTIPGAPTIYYGDEVGVTGDDDPDDRRTFPWDGSGPRSGLGGDADLLAHFKQLAQIRNAYPILRDGELTFLLTDDANSTLAYMMRTPTDAAVIAVNRNDTAQSLTIDISGMLPKNVRLRDALHTIGNVKAASGVFTVNLPPMSAAILVPTPGQDLVAPNAAVNLTAVANGLDVQLNWDAVPDADLYRIYRSPVSGGGYELIAQTNSASYIDPGLPSGQAVYYVVTAIDLARNISPRSNEADAVPAYNIGWANLQWPPTISHTIGFGNYTGNVYGQVWIDGVTSQPGPTDGLWAQVGFGPEGSNPDGNSAWNWADSAFNADVGNNDEFFGQMLPQEIGVFDYVYRYSTNGGLNWLYADLNGPIPGGLPPNPGKLTVNSTGDTTPPAAPTNLTVTGAAPTAIDLAWDAHPNTDGDLAGFEIYRDGGLVATVVGAGATSYTDNTVTQGSSYDYYVVAVDSSYNRSGPSNTVNATAALRTVNVTFHVTAPPNTPPAQSVHIAGSLHLLDGNLPEWDSTAVSLTQVGAFEWEITLSGLEGTTIQYKYTLGSPDFFDVEKGTACEEINNRVLTLDYGTDGNQTVNDTVANWRNVAPCGN